MKTVTAHSLRSVLLTLLLIGCRNDQPKPIIDIRLLTGKDWLLTACTIAPAYQGSSDYYPQLQACVRDNVGHYDTGAMGSNGPGGAYRELDGLASCDPSHPPIVTGVWSYNTKEGSLWLALTYVRGYYKSGRSYQVVSLSESELVVQHPAGFLGAASGTITETYTRQ